MLRPSFTAFRRPLVGSCVKSKLVRIRTSVHKRTRAPALTTTPRCQTHIIVLRVYWCFFIHFLSPSSYHALLSLPPFFLSLSLYFSLCTYPPSFHPLKKKQCFFKGRMTDGVNCGRDRFPSSCIIPQMPSTAGSQPSWSEECKSLSRLLMWLAEALILGLLSTASLAYLQEALAEVY